MITNTKHISQSAVYALLASCTIVSLLFTAFLIAEPSISHGQTDTSTFYIRQTITDESSFLVNPTNVTMAGDLNGVTGGNATGSTQFVVQTNNSAGYYVEIDFYDNSTSETMLGDETSSQAIRDYDGDATGEPSFGFTASSASQFAYTVHASTSSDIDLSFQNDGGNCNASGFTTTETCWKAPSTAAFRIIDTTAAAVTGATSSIQFKIHVPNAAVPVPQAETYTATATLSLYIK